MSFSSDFASCLAPMPTPGQAVDDLGDLLEFLDKLHSSMEASGGNEEMTLAALVAAGALVGVDETVVAAFAAAGALTLGTYIAACAACAVSAAGSSIWDSITSSNVDPYVKQKLTVAANDAGVQPTSAIA